MKIITMAGRAPNWMAGRGMSMGPWIPPLVLEAIGDEASGGGGGGGASTFDEILTTLQNVINTIGPVLFGDFITIGPSYDSTNGGEVRRQLEGLGQLNQPWANAYLSYIREYEPQLWQSGDIWDVAQTSYAHPSTFKDKYLQLVAAGMPNGALVDRNMVPVGLVQAAQSAASGATQTAGMGWLPLAVVGGLLLFTYSRKP